MLSLGLSPRRLLRSRIVLACFLILPILILHFGMSGPGFSFHIPLLPQPDSRGRTGTGGRAKGSNGHHFKHGPREHKYHANGILEPNPKGQHPIYDLIERGHHQWETKLDRASKTLAEAVNEYRRRYNRSPPKGFDRWWAWASGNGVQLPDEYDQIYRDLEPFWAMTSAELNEAQKKASAMDAMYTISCKAREEGGTTCSLALAPPTQHKDHDHLFIMNERSQAQLDLVKDIEMALEPVEAVFWSHDGPWQFVGHDYKYLLQEAAALGQYYDEEEIPIDMTHLGWASACAPHQPLRANYNISIKPDLDKIWSDPHKFVWDHKAAMDPCTNPTIVHLSGFLLAFGKGPEPYRNMYPTLTMCKTQLHSDVLAVSAEWWTEEVGNDPEWDDKKWDKLLWRGKTTGILYDADISQWNLTQRVNLVSHANAETGSLPVYPLTSPGEAVGKPVDRSYSGLNKDLLDVAFVEKPIQCAPKDCEMLQDDYRWEDRMNWGDANEYKYLLDVDGNGWSARFKRLLSTNSVVLKSTIFPEWFMDHIQPWVHYVPLKPDLTDLYDVMSFFHDGHDELAKRIAQDGKEWSKQFWRKEDMISYQFRLFLELSRLTAPDREEASYKHLGSELETQVGHGDEDEDDDAQR